MTKVSTGTDELIGEVTQRVAVVRLNKPHRKNALGDILTPALRALLPQLEEAGADRADGSVGEPRHLWFTHKLRDAIEAAQC